MITAVFGTNVLASGFIRPHSVPGTLLGLWSTGAFHIVVSEPILTELQATFEDPYFRRQLSSETMADDLALLRRKATVTGDKSSKAGRPITR